MNIILITKYFKTGRISFSYWFSTNQIGEVISVFITKTSINIYRGFHNLLQILISIFDKNFVQYLLKD